LYYYHQLLVLRSYQHLTPLSSKLNELVQKSQIDTKKYGNTLALQTNFYNNVNNLISTDYDNFFIANRPDIENPLLYYFKKTFLYKKLNNAILTPRAILKDNLMASTYSFRYINDYVLGGITGRQLITTKDGSKLVSK